VQGRSRCWQQENYVEHTLRSQKALPPIGWDNWWRELEYVSCAVIIGLPLIALYGFLTVPLQRKTAVWAVAYYFITGLGAHRWRHVGRGF
jgi:stearoyl-CoA desaturase (delta-9 desaturase)